MTKPSSRQQLIDYSLRKLGFPVLEINVDDDQIDDLVDDALQYFQERHFDGIERTFLKHEITEDNLETFKSGITTTTATSGIGVTSPSFTETQNFLQLPDHVLGVEKVFKMDQSTISSGLFNIKYQIFLNDIYSMTHGQILHYFLTSQYLETLDFVTNSQANRRVKWNEHSNRLYLDFDWDDLTVGDYIMVDMTMRQDPDTYTDMYNDNWLKDYVEALFQQQWGRNLSKYDGIQMLGGVTLNGRQILEDASQFKADLEKDLRDRYETPPLDIVG